MKVSLLQENLLLGVSTAGRSTSSKGNLPILSHVLLATDQGRLRVSATNLEIGVNMWVGAKVEIEGSLAVPARILQELLQTLPPGKLDLEVVKGNLNLKASTTEANISGIPGSEFPAIPAFPKDAKLSFPAGELSSAVESVAYASASEDGRPILTGVLWKSKGKSGELVATDGYRLSKKTMVLPEEGEAFQALVPARSLNEIARLISEQASRGEALESVRVGLDTGENQISFSLGDTEVTSRLLTGDYPSYENILPKDASTRGVFVREDLIQAIRQAAVFARDLGSIVKLTLNKGGMELSANTAQVGDEKTNLPGEVEGEEVTVAFNSRYLLDALGHLKSSQVTFEIKGNLSPGVFQGIGEEGVLTLVMPVRLQG